MDLGLREVPPARQTPRISLESRTRHKKSLVISFKPNCFVGYSRIYFSCVGWKIRIHPQKMKNSLRKIALPMSWIIPAFLVVGFSAIRGELRFYWTAPALIPLTFIILHSLSSHRNPLFLLRFSFVSMGLSLCLLTLILYFPVGEYLRPIVESYRTYDIRFSPRGDLEGWRELAIELGKKFSSRV